MDCAPLGERGPPPKSHGLAGFARGRAEIGQNNRKLYCHPEMQALEESLMRYRGFSARIQYDDEDETFFGYLVGGFEELAYRWDY